MSGAPKLRPGDRRPAPAGRPGRPKLTSRGSVLVLVAVFLVGNLIAVAAQVPWLAGLGFAAGSLLAVAYTRREGLLLVVTAPPLIFLITLVGAELLAGGGHSGLAAAEGTILTLAAVAPWLFCVVLGCLVVGMFSGLPRCVRELRSQLSGRVDTADGPASPGPGRS